MGVPLYHCFGMVLGNLACITHGAAMVLPAEASGEVFTAFCTGQIAHYKIPRYDRFVDSFPMTVTGKIQKFIMREHTIAELGLKVQQTA